MTSIRYTEHELREKAKRAIRDDAKAAGIRATYGHYELIINGPIRSVMLQAHGYIKSEDRYFFVNVAI